MKIYVGHASSFDYHTELYQPLRIANFWLNHTVVLPHDGTREIVHSKPTLADCDLLIAEVSYPSTGLGIEIGWAETHGCEILFLYKKGTILSSSLSLVSTNFLEYTTPKVMISKLDEWVAKKAEVIELKKRLEYVD